MNVRVMLIVQLLMLSVKTASAYQLQVLELINAQLTLIALEQRSTILVMVRANA